MKNETIKKNNYEIFLNKRVKLFLKNKFCYTGVVISIDNNSLLLRDKFNQNIIFNVESISTIYEHDK